MRKLAGAALAGVMIVAMPVAAKERRSPAMPGQMVLYEQKNFVGDYHEIEYDRTHVETEWNIRSIAIHEGDRWQVCAKRRFQDCIELDRSLPDASVVGIQGQIGSARQIKGD